MTLLLQRRQFNVCTSTIGDVHMSDARMVPALRERDGPGGIRSCR
jgi:hypothetical protein